MSTWKNYILPSNLSEALNALAAAPGPARVIAGGTDLLLDLQQGRQPPIHTLVDVSRMPETNQLEMRQGELFIGACVPLNCVVANGLVRQHAPGLVEACGLIGGPQVRNTATLGGNVAHALPAADGAISLLAHDAQAEVASASGLRRVPLGELFLGPGRSALQPGEVLVGFYLPARQPGQSSAFRRVMRPQGVAIAILNMAVWLEREGDCIRDVRIAAGPGGPTPYRALAAESTLRGRLWNAEALEAALQGLLAGARFRTSPHRSTAEYRRHVAAVLLDETMNTAWQRAADSLTVSEL